MSMIGLRCPSDIAAKLSKISVPGKKEESDGMHITMFYFEAELSVKQTMKAAELIIECIKSISPFTVSLSKIDSFPEGDDGVPVIMPIKSDSLFELREKLAKKFDDNKLKYSKKFPEYKPHLTLSYADKDIEKKVEAIKWKVSDIVIWAGDHHEDQMIVSIPFGFGKSAGLVIAADIFHALSKG